MYCDECGKQLEAKVKFCSHCGHIAPLVSTLESKSSNMDIKNKKKGTLFPIVLVLIIAAGFLISRIQLQQNSPGNTLFDEFSNTNKKRSLELTYNKIAEIVINRNYADYYDYILPSEKSLLSLEQFLQQYVAVPKTFSIESIVHSIDVSGDRGLIDRTRIICFTETCSGTDRFEVRNKKEFFYINGKWYVPSDNNVYCDRENDYVYPEEFKRAISLIIQRGKQSYQKESNDRSKNIEKIQKCLDIQYAVNDSQMQGAEGYFIFDQNSTPDRLQIYISPKYKVKDDLLTALLLTHELHHAYSHAVGNDTITDCIESEAEAFTQELGFFEFDLNKEEQNSILNRYGTSEEIRNFINLRKKMLNADSPYIYDRVLPMIQSDPFYQKQCNSN